MICKGPFKVRHSYVERWHIVIYGNKRYEWRVYARKRKDTKSSRLPKVSTHTLMPNRANNEASIVVFHPHYQEVVENIEGRICPCFDPTLRQLNLYMHVHGESKIMYPVNSRAHLLILLAASELWITSPRGYTFTTVMGCDLK